MFANSSAWTRATGASWPDVRLSSTTKRRSPVVGSASVRITGVRCAKNGRNSAIASLIDGPRPASASPNPVVAACALSRVAASNMLSTSSYSIGGRSPGTSAIVPPGPTLLGAVHRPQVDVLQPEHGPRPHDHPAVRGRLADLSSLMWTTAIEARRPPLHLGTGLDLVDRPDAEAAQADLVADDQVRAARQLRP